MNHPTPRTDAFLNLLPDNPTIPQMMGWLRKVPDFCNELERELADSISRSDFLEYQAAKASEIAIMQGQLAALTRPAKLDNPLYDVLEKMEGSMSQRIRDLADYMRNPLDHENRSKAMVAFREDLERYDAKIRPVGIPATVLPPIPSQD